MKSNELSEAIREGDCDTIRSLLDAGADIGYVRPRGYTAMIEAIYSLAMYDDTRWFCWSEEKVNAELRNVMVQAYADLKATKAQYNSDWRTAAFALAVDRVAKASAARGCGVETGANIVRPASRPPLLGRTGRTQIGFCR